MWYGALGGTERSSLLSGAGGLRFSAACHHVRTAVQDIQPPGNFTLSISTTATTQKPEGRAHMSRLQAIGSTVQCAAPRIPTLLASRGCLARRAFLAVVRAGVDERSIVGEVNLVPPHTCMSSGGGRCALLGYTAFGILQDFGARDPTPGELASNFTDKVLGNWDTAHIIRCSYAMTVCLHSSNGYRQPNTLHGCCTGARKVWRSWWACKTSGVRPASEGTICKPWTKHRQTY